MSEIQEVIATVIKEGEPEDHPEFTITLNGSDVHAMARHIASIEVEGDEAVRALASAVAKIVQIFAKRQGDFSIINFISECGFEEDKKSPLIVAANALHLRASVGKASQEECAALASIALRSMGLEPIEDMEDGSFEAGAYAAAPQFIPGKDRAYVIKPDSRHKDNGPFDVVEVDTRKNSVTLMINGTKQDYKSFNVRRADEVHSVCGQAHADGSPCPGLTAKQRNAIEASKLPGQRGLV